MAGAAGAVIVSYEPDVAFSLPLPAIMVTQDQFTGILAYVNRTRYDRVQRSEFSDDCKFAKLN